MNVKKMGIWFVALAAILLAMSTAAATEVYMEVSPAYNGSPVTVTVFVDNVTDLAGFDIFLKYDPTILQYDSYSLGADTQAFTLKYDLTPSADTVEIAALTTSPNTSSVTGTDVEILKVTFMAIAEGNSTLEFAAGSNLVQYNASSNQVVVYPGVTFQNTTVTVQAPPAPGPAPAGAMTCDYLDKSVVFTDVNSNLEVTVVNVECINQANGVLRLTYSEGSDLIVRFTYPTDGYGEIKITDTTTGNEVSLPADVRQSRDGQFEIPMDLIGPGSYTIYVQVYDRNGNAWGDLDTGNPATFSRVAIEGTNIVLNQRSYVVQLFTVEELPSISIDVKAHGGNKVVKGDRIYFEVNVKKMPSNGRVYCYLEGPYQGIYDQFTGYPRYINQSHFTVSLDTGQFVANYGAETGKYLFVVYVIDWTTNRTKAVETAEWELVGIDIDVVQPTDSRLGQKIAIRGTTNVADTGSEYDAGTGNYAYVEFYHKEGGAYRLTLLDPKINASDYAACANLPDDQKKNASICPEWDVWRAQVRIKGGKWELPSPLYLFPSWDTGSYKLVVEVVTNSVLGISDSTTYYFTVSEPRISFDMKTSYVRGEGIRFTGKSDVEYALSEFNFELVRYLPLQTWIFITPVGDNPTNDANVWEQLTEEYTPATVPRVITTFGDVRWARIGGNATFVQIGNDIGILAPITEDDKFLSVKLHIDENASRVTYTFNAYIAYWDPAPGVSPTTPRDQVPGTVELTPYQMVVSIRVAKELVTVNVNPSILVRGQEFTVNGTAPRDDTVYLFTDERNVIVSVPRIPSDDNVFTADPNGNLYSPDGTPTGETWYPISTTDYKFESLLKIRLDADPGTYVLYVIQPADRDPSDGTRFDPAEDAVGMVTITVLEFGFNYVPSTFEMVPGDYRDFMVEIRGDPDNVVVTMDISGYGLRVRDIPLVKFNESEDGSSGWMFATLYTFYVESAAGSARLTDRFQGYDITTPLKPDQSFKIELELADAQNRETVAKASAIWSIIEPELKVTIPSQVTAGDEFEIKIDTNHMSKGYDDVHVIVDLGADLIKILSIPLDENGDATVKISTAGWDPGEYTVWVRDRMKTYYDRTNAPGSSVIWNWDTHYDWAPVGTGEVDYSALKDIAAQDDGVVKRPLTVVEAGAPPVTTTPAVTTTTPPAVTPTTTTPPVEVTTTATPPPVTTTPGGGIPGFEAVFAIAGLLAVAYLLRRR